MTQVSTQARVIREAVTSETFRLRSCEGSVLAPPQVRSLLVGLLGLDLAWVVLHLLFFRMLPHFSKTLAELFALHLPMNLPTWFASMQLLAVAFVGVWLAWRTRATGAPSSSTMGWLALSTFFLLLSVDESCELHERIGNIVAQSTRNSSSSPWLEPLAHLQSQGVYAWVLIFALPLGLASTLLFHGLRRGLAEPRGAFALALTGLVALALSQGIEVVEGLLGARGRQDLIWTTCMLEEFLEMLGVSLLLVALLARALSQSSSWQRAV